MISASTLRDFPALRAAGLSPRTPKAGPELSLVCDYVNSQLPTAPSGQLLTVFLEPRIESGFPDAVAVYWDKSAVHRWSSRRLELTTYDVRVLNYVATAGPVEISQLRSLFGRGVRNCLERLYNADLIQDLSETLSPRPLDEIFGVRRLIAIEGKIREWRRGLIQALQNTWFASESYLLVPHIPRNSALVAEARRLNVGVVSQRQHLENSEAMARQERIPKSYASWLFNEWAWRTTYINGVESQKINEHRPHMAAAAISGSQ